MEADSSYLVLLTKDHNHFHLRSWADPGFLLVSPPLYPDVTGLPHQVTVVSKVDAGLPHEEITKVM